MKRNQGTSHGQTQAVATKPMYYVLGYPKSGNTWVARMVADLSSGAIAAADAVNAARIHLDNTRSSVVKQHTKKASTPGSIAGASRVIYVVRDIRDVVVSAFFFNNPWFSESWLRNTAGPLTAFARVYMSIDMWLQVDSWGPSALLRLRHFLLCHKRDRTVGNWSENVASWMHSTNVLIVRYEDLLLDCGQELSRIVDYLGIAVPDGRLSEVIRRHEFSSLKAVFSQRNDTVNTRFLRRGRSGDWKRYLGSRLLTHINARHGAMMRNLGYSLF